MHLFYSADANLVRCELGQKSGHGAASLEAALQRRGIAEIQSLFSAQSATSSKVVVESCDALYTSADQGGLLVLVCGRLGTGDAVGAVGMRPGRTYRATRPPATARARAARRGP